MKTGICSNLAKAHQWQWILPFTLLCMFLSSCIGHVRSPVVHVPPSASVTQAAGEEDSELPGDQIRLRHGTSFWLMITESISSKRAKVGDRVKLQVAGTVKVGDLVVIANKASAFATITEVKKAGLARRPGSVTLRPESITLVNGQQIPLQPTPLTHSGDRNALTEEDIRDTVQFPGGLGLVALPFLPLKRGKQAELPRGTVEVATIQGSTILERASIESSQPETPRRDETLASLTIYYPEFAQDGSVTVWCGAARVGKLRRGRRLNLKLPPGTYRLRYQEKEPGTSFNAESGGDGYMEISSPKGGMNRVDRDLGEARAAFTLPADRKDIQDLTKVALSDLQKP